MIFSQILEEVTSIYRPLSSTLLGFSGGVDSTVLFFLLLEIRKQRPDFVLEVCYFNHRIPGNEGYAEQAEQRVKELSQKHGVVCHCRGVGTGGYSPSRSIEEQGRSFRYKAFHEIKRERGLCSITTAHHRDDLIETVLLRLFQGVSPSRLSGIQPVRGDLIRPLLSFSKEDLRIIADQNHYSYVEDPTNETIQYKRNRLRLALIPHIREQFPVFDRKIVEFLSILEEQNREWLPLVPLWHQGSDSSSIWIPRDILESCSSFLRKESIKNGILQLDPNHYLTYHQLNKLSHYIEEYQSAYVGEKTLYRKGSICLKKRKDRYICETVE